HKSLPPTTTSTLSLHDALPIYGDDVRTMRVERPRERGMQRGQPRFDRSSIDDRDDAVIDVPHDRPSGVLDHAEPAVPRTRVDSRSEEHTSELQSQSNLVCRLLL